MLFRSIDPKYFAAYTSRGVAKECKGDHDGAIADYTRTIELNPKDAAAYTSRGLAKGRKHDHDGAIADHTRVVELDPKYYGAYYIRGLAKSDKGDFAGAIADYTRAIEIVPKYAAAYLDRGFAKRDKGDLDGAIADFTRIIKFDPKDACAYKARATVKCLKGDLAGAIADHTHDIKHNPNNAIHYYDRGCVKSAKGDPDGAIADYTRAIDLDPQYGAAYHNRGVALYLQKNWLKAYGDFDQASLHEKPGEHQVLLSCAVQTRLGQGEAGRTELRAWLDQRRDAKPGDWVSQLSSFLLGTLDEAALRQGADAPDAKKTREQLCDVWYYAGMQRLAAGQKAEAASCFRKCIATEQKDITEYQLATAELGWLGEK